MFLLSEAWLKVNQFHSPRDRQELRDLYPKLSVIFPIKDLTLVMQLLLHPVVSRMDTHRLLPRLLLILQSLPFRPVQELAILKGRASDFRNRATTGNRYGPISIDPNHNTGNVNSKLICFIKLHEISIIKFLLRFLLIEMTLESE